MKHSNLMFLVIGAALFIFGCSSEDLLDLKPVRSGHEMTLNKKVAHFTGTSIPVAPMDPGRDILIPDGRILRVGQTAEWFDEADDWRVTGKSLWTINWLIEKEPAFTAELWGTAEIFVGVKDPGDVSRGKWEISWHGWQTPTSGGGFQIVVDAVGTGVQGEVRGLGATWTYTMNIPDGGFLYTTEGEITHKKPCMKKRGTPFVVLSTPVGAEDDSDGTKVTLPNGKTLIKGAKHTWYDDGSDPRITGKSVWYINQLIEPDGITAKIWGKAEITADDGLGKWSIFWRGTITPAPPLVFVIKIHAVGHGTEGAVKGLVANWTYTLNFDGDMNSFYYLGDGVIKEKPGYLSMR